MPEFAMPKHLLRAMALVEVGTGASLLFAPSIIVKVLLGDGLSSPQSLVLARIAGAALISIAMTCWLASNAETTGARGLVRSMLVYNVAVPMLLIHTAITYEMRGIGLWPACVLHTSLAIWCMVCV